MVMPKKRYTPEEIIQHLRTVELETSKGLAVLDACRKLGITEQRCVISCSTGSCSTR
jgi:putative transposase